MSRPARPRPAARTPAARKAPTAKKTPAAKKAPAAKSPAPASPTGDLGFDFAALEEALTEATRAAVEELFEENPGHRFYCVALYTSGQLDSATLTAMSEEGLAEAVASYRQKPRYAERSVAVLREQLRWSPEDSPHHELGDEHFEAVAPMMRAQGAALRAIDVRAERPRFDAFVARAHEAFYNVLHRLDGEGRFGTGAARARVFVSVLKGDQDDSALALGARLNPPAAVERYRRGRAA